MPALTPSYQDTSSTYGNYGKIGSKSGGDKSHYPSTIGAKRQTKHTIETGQGQETTQHRSAKCIQTGNYYFTAPRCRA